jgi:hypothetical protein
MINTANAPDLRMCALAARVFTHAGNPRIVLQHGAFGLG